MVLLFNQQAKHSSFTLIQDKGKQQILPIKKLEPLNIFAPNIFFKWQIIDYQNSLTTDKSTNCYNFRFYTFFSPEVVPDTWSGSIDGILL